MTKKVFLYIISSLVLIALSALFITFDNSIALLIISLLFVSFGSRIIFKLILENEVKNLIIEEDNIGILSGTIGVLLPLLSYYDPTVIEWKKIFLGGNP